MCIIFVYHGEETNPSSDYCLILASNRDEFYDRPAIQAAPWLEDPSVIGGRDMEVGREGGTWFAMSPERAKAAILLNLTGFTKRNGKGRGSIVSNFVSGKQTSKEYFEELIASEEEYSYFNLVTVEVRSKDCLVSLFSNYDNKSYEEENVHLAYGNSLKDVPLKKVQEGKKRFADIVNEFGSKKMQDQLVDQLLQLLKWDKTHYPDEELDKRNPKWSQFLSSVYVKMPVERYGTRTHTLILVDKDGNMDFIEETMKAPVDASDPEWISTHIKRKLNLSY